MKHTIKGDGYTLLLDTEGQGGAVTSTLAGDSVCKHCGERVYRMPGRFDSIVGTSGFTRCAARPKVVRTSEMNHEAIGDVLSGVEMAQVDVIEALVLAQACAGFDVTCPPYIEALDVVVSKVFA